MAPTRHDTRRHNKLAGQGSDLRQHSNAASLRYDTTHRDTARNRLESLLTQEGCHHSTAVLDREPNGPKDQPVGVPEPGL
jgi:hypothetical protein